jgi:hypothetical protein
VYRTGLGWTPLGLPELQHAVDDQDGADGLPARWRRSVIVREGGVVVIRDVVVVRDR